MIKDVKQSTKVITGKVRFAYLSIFEPRAAAQGEEPRYNLQALIPKSEVETINKINLAVEAAMRAGAAIWGGTIPGNLKLPLRDGDLEKPEQAEPLGRSRAEDDFADEEDVLW